VTSQPARESQCTSRNDHRFILILIKFMFSELCQDWVRSIASHIFLALFVP